MTMAVLRTYRLTFDGSDPLSGYIRHGVEALGRTGRKHEYTAISPINLGFTRQYRTKKKKKRFSLLPINFRKSVLQTQE